MRSMRTRHVENSKEHFCSFLEGLEALTRLFQDTLDEWEIQQYWRVIAPELALAEWHAACEEAMRQHRLYKMPLPAELLAWGLACRERRLDEQRLRMAARGLPQRDPALDALSQEELRQLLDDVWPGGLPRSMPPPAGQEVEGPAGLPLYDSGRTWEEEKARKELLRRQLDAVQAEQRALNAQHAALRRELGSG
jgi:hypothetical protein